ncbi:MAG: hypothetical protein U9O95_02775 [Candidatus Marinimicrobia bacterium]|nr:hypothetical protein [Candidatus Neomarinimicrobiota bacterium]
MKRLIYLLLLCFFLISMAWADKMFDLTIRSGQGGFIDERSPIGKLGGGELTLDIKLRDLPFALSFSGEYYTNGPDPTHAYEIAGSGTYSLLYMNKLFSWERVNVFTGAGPGYMEVPVEDALPAKIYETAWYLNVEAGINVRVLWKFGLYGVYKYMYAYKEGGSILIDFNEHIVLLGLTFNFSI